MKMKAATSVRIALLLAALLVPMSVSAAPVAQPANDERSSGEASKPDHESIPSTYTATPKPAQGEVTVQNHWTCSGLTNAGKSASGIAVWGQAYNDCQGSITYQKMELYVDRCNTLGWGCVWSTTVQQLTWCDRWGAGAWWCPNSGTVTSQQLSNGYLYRVRTEHSWSDGSTYAYATTSSEVDFR